MNILMNDEIKLIHYYLVIPNIEFDNLDDLTKVITPINSISKAIVDNVDYLETLYYLPSVSIELIYPLNYLDGYKKKYKGLNYDINILLENDIEKELKLFKDDTIACIFICDGVQDRIINKIINMTKCPIVTRTINKNTITFNGKNTVEKIYNKFSELIGKKLDDKNINFFETQYSNRSLDSKIKICNIYLDVLISVVNNSKNSNKKLLNQVLKKAGIDPNVFFSYLKNFENDIYNNMLKCLLDNFEALEYMPFDINICVPSIDHKQIIKHWNIYNNCQDNEINHSLSNKVNSIAKKLSRNAQAKYGNYNIDYIDTLISSRKDEIRVLNLLELFFGYARNTPFVMMDNVPTDKISSSVKEIKRANKYLSFKDITVINNNFSKISSILHDNLEVDKIVEILRYGSHIKIFSDLPIEWLQINDVPLINLTSLSRVPITPFNGLIHHANIQNDYIINKDSFSIMIINAIDKSKIDDKELFGQAQGLKRFIKDHLLPNTKIQFQYIEANNKEEYFNKLNDFKPDILLHYGHGSFGEDENNGVLKVGKDNITPYDINRFLVHPPKIVLLGSCETQVDWNISDNIANSFISAGVVSVLGAHFSIIGKYTHHFFIQILHCISQVKEKEKNVNWTDIISHALKFMYLFDTFRSLSDSGHKLVDAYKAYCENQGFDMIDVNFHDRVIDFLKMKNSRLAEIYDEKRNQKSIFYHILYFSSLGSPELISFE